MAHRLIGQFAQAIVASEISHNQFTIRTEKPNVKVSWQVTGIRQEAYANAHRIQVEEDKPPQDQGHYLHSEQGRSRRSATTHRRPQRNAEANRGSSLQAPRATAVEALASGKHRKAAPSPRAALLDEPQ